MDKDMRYLTSNLGNKIIYNLYFVGIETFYLLLLGWIATMIQMKIGLLMESFSTVELCCLMYRNGFAHYNIPGIHFY